MIDECILIHAVWWDKRFEANSLVLWRHLCVGMVQLQDCRGIIWGKEIWRMYHRLKMWYTIINVVFFCFITTLTSVVFIKWRYYSQLPGFLLLQHIDSERGHVSRTGSTSKRAVVSRTRPSSSVEPSDNRNGQLGSGRDHPSTMQRLLPGFESKSSTLTQPNHTRVVRDDTFRSFDLLTIGSGKKKW